MRHINYIQESSGKSFLIHNSAAQTPINATTLQCNGYIVEQTIVADNYCIYTRTYKGTCTRLTATSSDINNIQTAAISQDKHKCWEVEKRPHINSDASVAIMWTSPNRQIVIRDEITMST